MLQVILSRNRWSLAEIPPSSRSSNHTLAVCAMAINTRGLVWLAYISTEGRLEASGNPGRMQLTGHTLSSGVGISHRRGINVFRFLESSDRTTLGTRNEMRIVTCSSSHQGR